MKLAKTLIAASLATLAAGHANAGTTTFSEGFENFGDLIWNGWSTFNLTPNPSGPAWTPGSTAEASDEGPIDSFVQTGTSVSYGDPRSDVNISTWLITPPIHLTGSDLLHFAIRGSGGSFSLNNFEVLVAPGSATSPDQFTQQIFGITKPPGFWLGFDSYLPEQSDTVRIAFHYFGPYSQSNYLALDTVSVTSAVPEPASALLLAAGLGGVALLRRRQQRRAD